MNDRLEIDKPLRIALLGCGTVGSQVARLLVEQGTELAPRVGRAIEVVGVAVRNLEKERPGVPREWLTDDALGLITREQPDIVVELIGGIEPANALIRAALTQGASVITANKALLGREGRHLFELAQSVGGDLYFEAAVAGAIPIVRPLRESLIGDSITSIVGIVNGTTNFIIEEMAMKDMAFNDALEEAKRLGYAEEDPTADIEGFDAASKAALLASLGFHTWVGAEQVYREGITTLTPDDFHAAKSIGCVIKLLAIAELTSSGEVSVRVHPALLPTDHTLATVSGAYNAILVEAKNAGRLGFSGPGAGGVPTASAVIGDIIAVGRHRLRGVTVPVQVSGRHLAVQDMGQIVTNYYLRFSVADAPGTLAQVGDVFSRHNVSVRTLNQIADVGVDDEAQLGVLTHMTLESEMQACITELKGSDFVNSDVHMLRAESI